MSIQFPASQQKPASKLPPVKRVPFATPCKARGFQRKQSTI